ncbi:MAG TPA: PqiC family protein [Opitutaceae bacterium]|jgi:hypothetical protein
MKQILVFVLPMLFAGCVGGGGKATVFLRLTSVEGTAKASAHAPTPVAVAAVDLPALIDREEFTTAAAGTQMQVTGDARWAGSLGEMIRLCLAQDLAHRTSVTVLMPGDPVPAGGVRTVHASIQTFLPDASGKVTLEADWWLTAPDGHTLGPRGRFRVALPGQPAPPAEAQTMSEALGKLADAMAAAL